MMKFFKYVFCSILLAFCCKPELLVAETAFTLSKKLDIPLLSAGTVVCVSGLALNRIGDSSKWDGSKRDTSDINGFDRPFAQPYSKGLDTAATIYAYSLALAPAALCLLPDSDWFTIGVMYAETVLFSQGIKEGTKSFVKRYRPYTYFDNPDTDDDEFRKSWPSGHTTTAFASASFISYVYWNTYPDSSYKVPVAALAYGAATIEGAMRVMSGNHFITDVISGAFLGTACGILIPFVHKVNKNKNKQIVLYSNGIGMRLQLE